MGRQAFGSAYPVGAELHYIELGAEFDYRHRAKTYPVTIEWDRRRIHCRLKLTTGVTKEFFIWEGSDAFVNYCIDKAKEIRSQQGRLHCVAGGHDYGRLCWIR